MFLPRRVGCTHVHMLIPLKIRKNLNFIYVLTTKILLSWLPWQSPVYFNLLTKIIPKADTAATEIAKFMKLFSRKLGKQHFQKPLKHKFPCWEGERDMFLKPPYGFCLLHLINFLISACFMKNACCTPATGIVLACVYHKSRDVC